MHHTITIHKSPRGYSAQSRAGQYVYNTARTFSGSITCSLSKVDHERDGIIVATPTAVRASWSDPDTKLTAKNLRLIHQSLCAEIDAQLTQVA